MARYIDADKMLANICAECLDKDTDECKNGNCTERNWINNTPTEDVQPVVHGGWVGDKDYEHMYGYYEAYKCSNCGCGVGYRSLYPYCPECGTKMKNGVTEEDRMRY